VTGGGRGNAAKSNRLVAGVGLLEEAGLVALGIVRDEEGRISCFRRATWDKAASRSFRRRAFSSSHSFSLSLAFKYDVLSRARDRLAACM
jgi:hypothetical protein